MTDSNFKTATPTARKSVTLLQRFAAKFYERIGYFLSFAVYSRHLQLSVAVISPGECKYTRRFVVPRNWAVQKKKKKERKKRKNVVDI